MIAIKIETQCDKLHERHREVARTLDHIRREKQTMDENRHWIDRSAYLKRRDLLDNLVRWYADETLRLDAALRRVREGHYGVCVECGKPIEERRLEACPDETLCANCHGEPRVRSA